MSDVLSHQPIESSSLAAVGYLPLARVLEIVFRSGAVYRYSEVPARAYHDLLEAESKGRYRASRGATPTPKSRTVRRKSDQVVLEHRSVL
jgi:hypothetical protein